jgi:hypothetical protein
MLVARASSGRKIPCRERHRIYVPDHLDFLRIDSPESFPAAIPFSTVMDYPSAGRFIRLKLAPESETNSLASAAKAELLKSTGRKIEQ